MIKTTTILTLTLTFGCLAGDIVFNPQAEHSHVRTVFVVCTNNRTTNEDWHPRQRAKWEEALLINGFNVVERSKIELIIREHKLNQSGLTEENQYLKAGELISADAVLYFNEETRVPGIRGYEYSEKPVPNNVKLVSIKNGDILFIINNEMLPQDKEPWRKEVIKKYRVYLDALK